MGRRISLSKGQIMTYSGKQLIDYPSLLTGRWYCDWIADDSVDPLQLETRDGKFTMHTAIRDQFVFDVASGELIELF